MIKKCIDYEDVRVQLDLSGGEPFGIVGIISGVKQGGVSYPRKVESQS